MTFEENEQKQYEKENNDLLEQILDNAFYRGFKDPTQKRYGHANLEMNITAACNQKCEYCYLVKYGDKIYPKEIRNEKNIIANINLLMNYFIDKKMNPGSMDIFSGEIWGTKFGNEVLQTILDGIDRGFGINYIMVPSNMSFLLYDTKRKAVEKYIDKYKEHGVNLTFSASVDGLILEENQRSFVDEKNNNKRTQEFYDMLFDWCKERTYCFHPMVAAVGIEHWCENYDWWQNMFRKHDLDPFQYGMYLEVRNNEWNIEKIGHYLKFLNHVIDYDYNIICSSDTEYFFREAICHNNKNKGYFPYVLLNTGDTYGCTLSTCLMIRMGDLAIGPCHRTHYEQFIFGKYNVEDGHITGVKANNVQLANMILNGNENTVMINCNKCPISFVCMKGCLGAQYEANGEILQPCASVCDMQKARVIFLYLKYKKIGFFDVDEERNKNRLEFLRDFEKNILKLKEGEPALWKYWEMKTMQII